MDRLGHKLDQIANKNRITPQDQLEIKELALDVQEAQLENMNISDMHRYKIDKLKVVKGTIIDPMRDVVSNSNDLTVAEKSQILSSIEEIQDELTQQSLDPTKPPIDNKILKALGMVGAFTKMMVVSTATGMVPGLDLAIALYTGDMLGAALELGLIALPGPARKLAKKGIIAALNKNPVLKQKIEDSLQPLKNLIDSKFSKSADDVNNTFPATYDPPYTPGTKVYEVELLEDAEFVRVYSSNYPNGNWLAKKADIEGLTPQQIQDKLALPRLPTHKITATVPKGTKVRIGEVGPNFGGNGGGTQYELFEFNNSDQYAPLEWFSGPTPI